MNTQPLGEMGLAAVDRLEDASAGYHAHQTTRDEMLRPLDGSQESRAAHDKAIELAGNTAEIAYLIPRRDQLKQAPTDRCRNPAPRLR